MQLHNRLPFDLRTLEVFLAICEEKTMGRAAELLGLTQPGVSQIIQDMERQLGVGLFDRTIRPIALTPAGLVLRRSASSLVADARRAVALVQGSRRGRLQSLRVGLIYSLQRLLTAPLISALSDSVDEIVMLSGTTSDHAKSLLMRRVDLCIGLDDLPCEAGLDRRLIVKEPYVLIVPRDTAVSDLKTISRSLRFVRYSARTVDGTEIERYLHSQGCDISHGAEFDTPFGLTDMVARGLGWAVSTPVCLIEAGVSLDGMSVRPLDDRSFMRTITLVCRHQELGTAASTIARASIQAVRDQCRDLLAGRARWILPRMVFGSGADSIVPSPSKEKRVMAARHPTS